MTISGMQDDGVLEVATLRILAGREAAFEQAFQQARLCLDGAQGHLSHSLHRCLEDASTYLLFIRWQTLEDHTVAFRAAPQHDEWKRLLSPFYEGRPHVAHYVSSR